MNGFPLKTPVRNNFCDKCNIYYPQKRHVCKVNPAFEKITAGTDEYTLVIGMLSHWDTGTWNTSLIIQAAKIVGTNLYYLIITNFFKRHNVIVLNADCYHRLQPYRAMQIKRQGVECLLYVNLDCSAAVIPISIFMEEE